MMCCVWSFLWFVFEWILQIAIKPFKIVSSRHRIEIGDVEPNEQRDRWGLGSVAGAGDVREDSLAGRGGVV